MTNAGISALVEGCQRLTSIAISCGANQGDPPIGDITADSLEAIAKFVGPRLTSFALHDAPDVAGEGFVALAQGCPNIARLSIHQCDSLNDEGLAALFACCPNISDLSFGCELDWMRDRDGEAEKITDLAFFALAKHNRSLSKLALHQCPHITSASLVAVANCSGLTSFNLTWAEGMEGDAGLVAIAKVGAPLIPRSRHSSDPFPAPQSCPKLTQFEVRYTGSVFSPAVLCALGRHCSELTHFMIDGDSGDDDYHVSDRGFEAFARGCPRLTDFYCSGFDQAWDLSDRTLVALAKNCPNLARVDAASMRNTTEAGWIALVRSCRNLVKLSPPGGSAINDRVLSEIAANSHNLKELSTTCSDVSDSGIIALASGLPRLKRISLSHCGISEAAKEQLKSAQPGIAIYDFSKEQGGRRGSRDRSGN